MRRHDNRRGAFVFRLIGPRDCRRRRRNIVCVCNKMNGKVLKFVRSSRPTERQDKGAPVSMTNLISLLSLH